MKKFLSIGHSTFDNFFKVDQAYLECEMNSTTCKICFDFGSKIPVTDVHYGIGGSASNVAIGASRLGIATSIYTIVGNDMKGMDIISSFKKHLINCALLKVDQNPTDQSTILSYHNDRTIFTYNHEREYTLKNKDVTHDYIFIGSTGKDISDIYADVKEHKTKSPDTVMFYNPGSREIKDRREEIINLLPYIDYLIVNIEEGCAILNPSLKRNSVETKDLLELLYGKEVKNVLLTDGGRGIHGYDGDKHYYAKAMKVKVVEKTGAGDAFTSGFIGATINGEDIETAMKWGVLNSAAAIQSFGAQSGLLTKEEIVKKLSTYIKSF